MSNANFNKMMRRGWQRVAGSLGAESMSRRDEILASLEKQEKWARDMLTPEIMEVLFDKTIRKIMKKVAKVSGKIVPEYDDSLLIFAKKILVEGDSAEKGILEKVLGSGSEKDGTEERKLRDYVNGVLDPVIRKKKELRQITDEVTGV